MKQLFNFKLILTLALTAGINTMLNAGNATIPSGSYIIDMGVTPQTIENALLPYGLVYNLTSNYQVSVLWSINPSKTKDGIDFTYNGYNYKGGPFIILNSFRTAAVDSVISAWETDGVVGTTTTFDFVAPIYDTIDYYMTITLDQKNGGIAEGFLQNANFPISSYNWVLPQNLNCCNDVFAMPHADPTWATHANLLTWNDAEANGGCNGAIWAACHAVSVLENVYNPSTPTQQLNFLMNDPVIPGDEAAVDFGDHGKGTTPLPYVIDTTLGEHPIMQFIGDVDNAVQNGSEQIYMPRTSWRSEATIAIYDHDHPDIPSESPGPAAVMAFGPAFGDTSRGYVMYEAAHNIEGSDEDNVAAQRAFMNFLYFSVEGFNVEVEVSIPENMEIGVAYQLVATANNGIGNFTYQWETECGGVFSDPTNDTTLFIPTFTPNPYDCYVTCIVADSCGTKASFDGESITILVPPTAPDASNDCNNAINPGDSVTFNVLDNDVDINNDPLTVTLIGSTTTANGGVFTNLGNGDIKYVSDTGFIGTDSIQYEVCDTTSRCDTAWICVQVDITDEFGCLPNETNTNVLYGYGFTQSDNGNVSNAEDVIGKADGNGAQLDVDSDPANRGQLTVKLNDTISEGANITLTMSCRDGNTATVRVSESLDGISFSNNEIYSLIGNSFQEVSYTIAGTDGANYIRFESVDNVRETRIDAVRYTVEKCVQSCGPTETSTFIEQNAQDFDVSSTSRESAKATLVPDADGAEIDVAEFLILDLEDTINEGGLLNVFIGKNSAVSANAYVSASIDGTTFSDTNTYSISSISSNFQAFKYIVPQLSGIRYVKIESGSEMIHVDAIEYFDLMCEESKPIARSEYINMCEDYLTIIDILANDTDPHDSVFTVTILSEPDSGSIVLHEDNMVEYLPNLDFSGADTVSYQICDPTGFCDTAFIYIIVTSDTCSPGYRNTTIIGTADNVTSEVSIDGEGNTTGLEDGSYGKFNQDNDELVLRLEDTVEVGTKAMIKIGMNGATGSAYSIGYMKFSTDNSTFTDSTSFTTTTKKDDGEWFEFNFPADAKFVQFKFLESLSTDNELHLDAIHYTVCLGPCEVVPYGPPIAQNDITETHTSNPVSIDITYNDKDQSGLALDIGFVSGNGPSNGSIEVVDGEIVYTPDAGYNGLDSFMYEICNPIGCDSALVIVNIGCLAGKAENYISGYAYIDSNLNSIKEVTETAPFIGMEVSLYVDSNKNGILDGLDYLLSTSTTDSAGFYSFSPTINRTYGTESATINGGDRDVEEVRNVGPSTNPVGYVDESSNTLELTDDAAYNGLNQIVGLRFEHIDIPQAGLITSSNLTFLSAADKNEAAHIVIKAEDVDNSSAFSSGNTSDISTRSTTSDSVLWYNMSNWFTENYYQSVDISPVIQEVVNRSGWPNNASLSIILSGEGVRTAYSDDGSSGNSATLDITYASVTSTSYIVVAEESSLGTNFFTGSVSDTMTFNNMDSSICNINFGVFMNLPPVAVKDSMNTNECMEVIVPAVSNDSDQNGNNLYISSILTAPANGTASIYYDQQQISYTPDVGFIGVDSLQYLLCDDGEPSLCDSAWVIVVLNNPPVNLAPIAVDDSEETNKAQVAYVSVLDNDSDPENHDLRSYLSAALLQPSNGSLGTLSNGMISYTPDAGFAGIDSFEYILCDTLDQVLDPACPVFLPSCDTAKVYVTVLNNPPVANIDNREVLPNTTDTINVLVNDFDPDLDSFSVVEPIFSASNQGGALSVETNGSPFADDDRIIYSAPSNYTGNDTFTYRIGDNNVPPAYDTTTVYINLPMPTDFGDLPNAYGKAGNQIYLDTTGSGAPSDLTAYWLGTEVDYESKQPYSHDASGDGADEDGAFFTDTIAAGDTMFATITLNANTAGTVVYYGLWIDWDMSNGVEFEDFYTGCDTAQSPVTVVVPTIVPAGYTNTNIAIRIRAFDEMPDEAQAIGTMMNGETEDYIKNAFGTLPVEITSFDSYEGDCEVELHWVTALEINNDHFEVQRSVDGYVFETIGKVDGAGNSTEEVYYAFTDENPLPLNYYRLKQVDVDGQERFHNIHMHEMQYCDMNYSYEMYPNPVRQGKNVIIQSERIESVVIFNSNGVAAFSELYRDQNRVKISTKGMLPGTYYVQINADQSMTLIVQ